MVHNKRMGGCVSGTVMFLSAFCVGNWSDSATAQWPQFGGPNRDFIATPGKIADKWPDGGPKKLWTRDLGDGYATILVDGDRLFTMYRKTREEFKPENEEIVVCMDAKTGNTVWEYKYDAPGLAGQTDSFGWGPNPTPLIVGDRIFTTGFTGVMHCLDKKAGSTLWTHNLAKEYTFEPDNFGYSISPIAYKDTVIVLTGGENSTIVAFKQSDGSVAWKSQNLKISHGSPILFSFKGRDQLAILLDKQLVGIDAGNGELLWEHPTPQQGNLAQPLWGAGDILFCSAAYDSGSRAVKLTEKEGKIAPEELWYTRKCRVQFGNAIRLGDTVYCSSGQEGPAFMTALNVNTGELNWRERGFAKAMLCYADNKLIILDEEGKLGLAKVSPEKFELLSECKISDTRCWSAPTVVGKTLYIRDRKNIMALDLG